LGSAIIKFNMRIITVINAKGGCGKSTIAMSLASGLAIRGQATLLIDMDPQAQVTQWLGLGDGLSSPGTLVQAMEGKATMDSIVQATKFDNLSFVASSQGLEDLGRQITDMEGYQTMFTQLLYSLTRSYEFVVIDSPNQISPVMENCIYPSDAFIVPFESTKAVRSYANFFQLLLRIRTSYRTCPGNRGCGAGSFRPLNCMVFPRRKPRSAPADGLPRWTRTADRSSSIDPIPKGQKTWPLWWMSCFGCWGGRIWREKLAPNQQLSRWTWVAWTPMQTLPPTPIKPPCLPSDLSLLLSTEDYQSITNNTMTKLPEGKTRLDLVKEGMSGMNAGLKKQGRLVVSIDRLKEDKRNERRTFRNMEGLIASIKAVGMIEPITVTADEEGSYRIITGHRRYRAAKEAGLVQVEILIREPDDEYTRRVKSIISNVQREDVGPVEMAEALQSLLADDEKLKTQDDLAHLLGKHKTWVSGMLKVTSLPVSLQKKVESTQLSIPYDAMIRIARLEEEKQQTMLVDQLLGGATQKEIRDEIDRLQGRPAKSVAGATTSSPKPKRVYHTKYKAVVIVQSEVSHLTSDQVMEALQDALGQATNS
jgi:ParB family chromosome partitioning protein